MHQKWNYSFVVPKHVNAAWIKRIMFIIEKANEREKTYTSFIKITASGTKNLGRNWIIFIFNQFILVIKSLMSLNRWPEKPPQEKNPRDAREGVKEKKTLLNAKLCLHHAQCHINNSDTHNNIKYCISKKKNRLACNAKFFTELKWIQNILIGQNFIELA